MNFAVDPRTCKFPPELRIRHPRLELVTDKLECFIEDGVIWQTQDRQQRLKLIADAEVPKLDERRNRGSRDHQERADRRGSAERFQAHRMLWTAF